MINLRFLLRTQRGHLLLPSQRGINHQPLFHGLPEDEKPVRILRDTGGSQSFILSNLLPFNTNTSCNASTIIQGIGMAYVLAPLHHVHLKSKLASGFCKVAVRNSFPVQGVEFIMGNDLAGNKILPIPEMIEEPSCLEDEDEMLRSHPDVFAVSVLTRSQARKLEEVNLDESVLGSVLMDDRLPTAGPSKSTHIEEALTSVPEVVLPVSMSRECLCQAQKGDETLTKCYEDVNKATNGNKSHTFYVQDGLLMRKWISRPALQQEGINEDWGVVHQIVIPKGYREQILQLAHEHPWSGHLGITKTYDRILQHFFWPGLKKDVARFCKTCKVCQIVGKPNQRVPPVPLKPIPAVGEPFERVLVDCVGPLPRTKDGNQFLLTVMCAATRFPEAIPLRKIT
ncbi:uncharacterized protein LOC106536397, partial [Austrofundulus limnaeus]|uniref:Gypsy retrotransposon integrase-like protein 1 n=1 Tax=Austrofundulus limnaeus TaxID=52670 RepID=A0A2I4DA54_AUSLI